MEYNFIPIFMWPIRIISFVALVLSLFAAVNIFKSMWFRFRSSKVMSDREKREFYIRNRYDVKWSLSLVIATMLESVAYWLMDLKELSNWTLLVSLLLWLLFWGNCRTLNLEKRHFERKKI